MFHPMTSKLSERLMNYQMLLDTQKNISTYMQDVKIDTDQCVKVNHHYSCGKLLK